MPPERAATKPPNDFVCWEKANAHTISKQALSISIEVRRGYAAPQLSSGSPSSSSPPESESLLSLASWIVMRSFKLQTRQTPVGCIATSARTRSTRRRSKVHATHQCTNGRMTFATCASSVLNSGESTCLSVNL